MAQNGVAFALAVLAWWASTGAIIMLCSLPRQTFSWSMAGATLALAAAIYGLVHSAWDSGASAVYIAFLSAIGVWGWIEMTFLMGYITGPRTAPCPAEATGWRRFQLALQTVLYHELVIVAAGIAVVVLTWKAPNQTGTFAFLILMAMRISAKLNIFLGVPNLTDELLPERLSYLKSYFRKCEVNSLFPVSVGLSALVAVVLAQRAFAADGTRAIGLALLFTLLALAILEHFFMIMPLPDIVLWRWALPMPKRIDKPLP